MFDYSDSCSGDGNPGDLFWLSLCTMRQRQLCLQGVENYEDEQTAATADPSTLLLVCGGVLCFFRFSKETKNPTNNEQLQITLTSLVRLLFGAEEDSLLLLMLGAGADSLLLVVLWWQTAWFCRWCCCRYSLLLLLWVAAAAISFLYYIQWHQNARANIRATNNWKQYDYLAARCLEKEDNDGLDYDGDKNN